MMCWRSPESRWRQSEPAICNSASVSSRRWRKSPATTLPFSISSRRLVIQLTSQCWFSSPPLVHLTLAAFSPTIAPSPCAPRIVCHLTLLRLRTTCPPLSSYARSCCYFVGQVHCSFIDSTTDTAVWHLQPCSFLPRARSIIGLSHSTKFRPVFQSWSMHFS